MRVPNPLSLAFGPEFQELISRFAQERGLLGDIGDLDNRRFLSRSVAPHVMKLSQMFNRTAELKEAAAAKKKGLAKTPELSLDPYWKASSNPEHLRLAYFLTFMPPNLYRVASVWAELSRLGFRWHAGHRLRGLELGAGPAAGATGIAAGEQFAPTGLPATGDWALIEQDKQSLELGTSWAERYFSSLGDSSRDWGTRPFHRKLTLDRLLPTAAPRFNLCVMSYFLNEFPDPASEIAEHLFDAWERHLDDDGIVIIVEPALRLISRRLLELRRELLKIFEKQRKPGFQILLPCLGHQACGALADAEDWCHEEVSWWRPPYLRKIDDLTGLDRKSLPFSYLVIMKTRRTLPEILPAVGRHSLHRLVSPAHAEGKEREFFVCGQDGKRRARLKPESKDDPTVEMGRGDILLDAELRGDARSTRVEKHSGLL